MKRYYSLKKNKDFQYVFRRGKSYATYCFVLIIARGIPKKIQFGFTVNKKVGNAVVRNRAKRRMREIIRHQLPYLLRGYKLVFIARPSIRELDFLDLNRQMKKALERAQLYI